MYFNPFHSTWQAWSDDNKKCQKMFKNVKILECSDYIWNHHEKRIQISTNMPGIGLEICEISRILRKQNDFIWMVKPMVACKVGY